MRKNLIFAFLTSVFILSLLISATASFIDEGHWVNDSSFSEVGHYMTFPEALWWNFKPIFIVVFIISSFVAGTLYAIYKAICKIKNQKGE